MCYNEVRRVVKSVLPPFLILLSVLTLGGCKSTKKVPPPGKHHRVEHSIRVGKSSKIRQKIVHEAESWLGVPYKYGGNDKREGTDCSGMVLAVYRDVTGIKMPRNSAAQAEFCNRIGERDLKPGDLVFFATGKDKERISHVGILTGEGRFIHSSTSKGVIESDLETPYYRRTFRCYGRVPGMEGK